MDSTYPKLTPAQISKLPWNRLKNIMNSVRAIMSDVENNYGYEKEYDGVVIEYELSPEFINKQHRDAIVESINAPMKEYFELLKARAAELPHQPKKRRK